MAGGAVTTRPGILGAIHGCSHERARRRPWSMPGRGFLVPSKSGHRERAVDAGCRSAGWVLPGARPSTLARSIGQ
eukprot:11135037-Lingulodinium_polyedra.AAC.1